MIAWIATEKIIKTTWAYAVKPVRQVDSWAVKEFNGMLCELPEDPGILGLESYPKWEDEPVEVELTVKIVK